MSLLFLVHCGPVVVDVGFLDQRPEVQSDRAEIVVRTEQIFVPNLELKAMFADVLRSGGRSVHFDREDEAPVEGSLR